MRCFTDEKRERFQLPAAGSSKQKASRYMRIPSETNLNKTVQSKIEKGYDLCMTVLQKRHLTVNGSKGNASQSNANPAKSADAEGSATRAVGKPIKHTASITVAAS